MNLNAMIIKQATVLSVILGAAIGLLALISPLMIYIIFALPFLCAPLVMIYMKKRKMIGILKPEQGAILGGIIGAASSLAFFAVFIPLVLIIGLIFKQYYTYGIPYLLNFQSFWLLVIIIITLVITLAITNATVGMGTAFVYNLLEPKPEGEGDEGHIDIKVE